MCSLLVLTFMGKCNDVNMRNRSLSRVNANIVNFISVSFGYNLVAFFFDFTNDSIVRKCIKCDDGDTFYIIKLFFF